MVISDSKKFIFVHIEKTAGTSVGQVILPYALRRNSSKFHSALRLFDLPRSYRSYKFRVHAPLVDIIRKMPRETFEHYYKFAFVRNPWDRLVSEYNAAVKKDNRRRHHKIKQFGTFSEFVDYEIARGKFFQYPMLCGERGVLHMDFIGRFENLQDDVAAVCQRLGLENTLGHFNRFDHAQYREFYDRKTRDTVARHWRREIEAFEYEF